MYHSTEAKLRSKVYLESQRRFVVAGDPGYPMSEVLIKHLSNNAMRLMETEGRGFLTESARGLKPL